MSQHTLKPEADGEALLEEALLAAAQELMAVRAEADAQVAGLREELSALQRQLQEARAELEVQRESHRKDLLRLQDELQVREEGAERPLSKLLGQLGPQIQAGEGERSRRRLAELRVAELERMVTDARDAHGRAERRAAQLLERVEVLEERFAETAAELTQAREELSQGQAQWEVSEELARVAVRDAHGEAFAQGERMRAELARAQQEAARLSTAVADLDRTRGRVGELEEALTVAETMAEGLSAKLAEQARARDEQLQYLSSELGKRKEAETAAFDQLQQLREELAKREAALQKVGADKATAVAALSQERDALVAQQEVLHEQVAALSEALGHRAGELRKSEQARAPLDEELRRLREQSAADDETRGQLESDLRKATAAQHALSQQLSALQTQLGVAQHEEESRSTLADLNERLSAELEQMRSALLAAENTIEELQAGLDPVGAQGGAVPALSMPPVPLPEDEWEHQADCLQLEHLRAEVAAIQTMMEVAEQRHRDEVQRLQADLAAACTERDLAATGAEQQALEVRQWGRVQQELYQLRELREHETLMAAERAEQLEQARARCAELERALAEAGARLEEPGLVEHHGLRTLPVPAIDGRRLSVPRWPPGASEEWRRGEVPVRGSGLDVRGEQPDAVPELSSEPGAVGSQRARGPTAIQKRLAAAERRDRDGDRATSYSVSDVQEEVVFPTPSRKSRGAP